MDYGDKVKVTKVIQDKEMNLWGGYDDVTLFVNATGTVRNVYDKDTICENYGIEFDDDWVQLTRERTGLLFSKEQLEIVKGDVE